MTDQGTPTILAGELSNKHLGLTFRSVTYRDKNKTTKPSPGVRFYDVTTIYHLANGAILLNGSYPYLRPDTVLTEVAAARQDLDEQG